MVPVIHTAPAQTGHAVTPSDSTDLPDGPCRALFIGSAGNIVVDFVGGTTSVTLTGVLAGVVYPLAVRRVRSSSTTAGSIVALY